jgi:radical SAM superfamily enzyme YgiQ (UPF0313 family)
VRFVVSGKTSGAAAARVDDHRCSSAGSWNKRLVDTNVERLKDSDLVWADVVLLSAMHVQQPDLTTIVRKCRARGLRTVVGGPISSSVPADALEADCVVIGEAEDLIGELARDLESGSLHSVYNLDGAALRSRRLIGVRSPTNGLSPYPAAGVISSTSMAGGGVISGSSPCS